MTSIFGHPGNTLPIKIYHFTCTSFSGNKLINFKMKARTLASVLRELKKIIFGDLQFFLKNAFPSRMNRKRKQKPSNTKNDAKIFYESFPRIKN